MNASAEILLPCKPGESLRVEWPLLLTRGPIFESVVGPASSAVAAGHIAVVDVAFPAEAAGRSAIVDGAFSAAAATAGCNVDLDPAVGTAAAALSDIPRTGSTTPNAFILGGSQMKCTIFSAGPQ